MAKLTPEEYAANWKNALSASTDKIRRGVERVTASPMEKAAAKQDKWLAGIQNAAQTGKWQRGLRSKSLEDWKSDTINKGIMRIPQGAAQAENKMAQFGSKLMSYQDTLAATVLKMPDNTFEDNVNRMVAWSRGMKKFQAK